MGTEPSRGSVEDGRTDPARALVLAVLDLLEGVEHFLVGAVLLGVLDDLLLVRGVVHATEGLLDVDRAHHAVALPALRPVDAPLRSGSGCSDDRGAARGPRPAQGGGGAGAGRGDDRGGRPGGRPAAQGRRPGRPAVGPGRAGAPRRARTGPAHRALRRRGQGRPTERAGAAAGPAAEAAPAPEPLSDDPAEDAVLSAFVRDGRLVSIPAQHSKRLVVLHHLVRVFEPGVRYPEREVNALLAVWHADVAALRRYLVDEGLLTREAGIYWRSGGRVDV